MIENLYDIVNQIRNPETMTNSTKFIIDGALAVSALVGYGLYNFIKSGNNDIKQVLRDYDNYLKPEKDDLAKRIAESLEKLK